MAEPNVPQSLNSLAGVVWRLLVVLAGFAVLLWFFNLLFAVVFALFFAMLVTAWTKPVMKLLQRFLPKAIAMIVALVLIVSAIVIILFIVVKSSIGEGPKLVASIDSGFTDIQAWLKGDPLNMSDADVTNLLGNVQTWAESVGKSVLSGLVGQLSGIGTLIVAGSVFMFAVIFFLMTPQRIWDWLLSWIPKKYRTHIDTSGRIAWDSISGYTVGIVVVAIADATLVFIGLLILQVPLAPALAAVVFFGAFIPVIGAPVATFFAAVVALAERGPLIALLVVGLTVVVGSFDGDVLQPLVMGKAVNLHPLAIVIVIAAGSIALGIVGALIAVPIAGAIYGIAKYVTNRDPEHPYESATVPAQE